MISLTRYRTTVDPEAREAMLERAFGEIADAREHLADLCIAEVLLRLRTRYATAAWIWFSAEPVGGDTAGYTADLLRVWDAAGNRLWPNRDQPTAPAISAEVDEHIGSLLAAAFEQGGGESYFTHGDAGRDWEVDFAGLDAPEIDVTRVAELRERGVDNAHLRQADGGAVLSAGPAFTDGAGTVRLAVAAGPGWCTDDAGTRASGPLETPGVDGDVGEVADDEPATMPSLALPTAGAA